MTRKAKILAFVVVAIAAAGCLVGFQQVVAPGQITGVSGSGKTLVTTTGAQTSGNCVQIDAAGNHVASGSSCGSGTVPTMASTGFTSFTTHPEAAATIADTAVGVSLASPDHGSDNLNAACKAAPAAPYTITGKFVITQGYGVYAGGTSPYDSGGGFTWRDSVSHKLAGYWAGLATTPTVTAGNSSYNVPVLFALDFTNETTVASGGSSTEGNVVLFSPVVWESLSDDNAGHVSYKYSLDGVNFVTLVTVTKSSGFLGSTGYNQVCVFLSAHGSAAAVSLQSYSQTSP